MSVSDSPVGPPSAVDDGPEYCVRIRLLSASGRLGRVRCIGFGTAAWLAFLALAAAISALGDLYGGGEIVGVLLVTLFFAVMGFTLLLTIQRCHDFNATGWLALVGLIPLGTPLLWVIPGTNGANRFGPRPPPNSLGAILLASSVALACVAGSVAAIAFAIP